MMHAAVFSKNRLPGARELGRSLGLTTTAAAAPPRNRDAQFRRPRQSRNGPRRFRTPPWEGWTIMLALLTRLTLISVVGAIVAPVRPVIAHHDLSY
jgi:hypothetical protein